MIYQIINNIDLEKLIVCDNRNLQPNIFDAIIDSICI
jgi:hypothetical protein